MSNRSSKNYDNYDNNIQINQITSQFRHDDSLNDISTLIANDGNQNMSNLRNNQSNKQNNVIQPTASFINDNPSFDR